jgi:acetyltransferase-like isoleucine patch superfamily enzyme
MSVFPITMEQDNFRHQSENQMFYWTIISNNSMLKKLTPILRNIIGLFFVYISSDRTSKIQRGKNVVIRNSSIILKDNSTLIIDEDVTIDGYSIYLERGVLRLGKNCIIDCDHEKAWITISNGSIKIGNNCLIRASIWVRFCGELTIGNYNTINRGTMIRCDERIDIGNFNMISYECLIFDTNTHEILPIEERRKITIKDFPFFGREFRRPKTKPVKIGSDVWIGQRAIVLKGTIMEDVSIAATAVVISNKVVPSKFIAYGNPAKIVEQK